MNKKTYEKIKDDLEEKIIEYVTDNNREFVRQGILALFKLKESPRLESYITKVNNEKQITKSNRTFISLYGLILLATRRSFSSDLSDDAIMLFADHYGDYQFMDEDIAECNPELLEAVCEKVKSLGDREDYYFVAASFAKKNPKENIVEKVKNMDKDEYALLRNKYESDDYVQKIIDKEKNTEFAKIVKKAGI